MKFVQFRLVNKEGVCIGVENAEGAVVDLSSAFPDCPRGLVEALSKHGSQGVIDKAASWYYLVFIIDCLLLFDSLLSLLQVDSCLFGARPV